MYIAPYSIIPVSPPPPAVPTEFLLISQRHDSYDNSQVSHTDVRLISLDAPPFFVDTPTSVHISDAEVRFIAYDITRHQVSVSTTCKAFSYVPLCVQVYWSMENPPQILRSSLNTPGDEEVFIQTSIAFPESLVVDPYAMNLYWVDSVLDKIEVVGITESNRYRRVLVRTGVKPQGLALDLVNR